MKTLPIPKMFNFPSIFQTDSRFEELGKPDYDKKTFLLSLLHKMDKSDLVSLRDELKGCEKKVSTLSDSLILRNSHNIIEEAKRIQDSFPHMNQDDDALVAALEKSEKLEAMFIEKYDRVESSHRILKNLYCLKKVASSYARFISLKNKLVQNLSKANDLEQNSELFLKCNQLIAANHFEELALFEDHYRELEEARKTLQADCEGKLNAALESLSFIDAKNIVVSLDNLGLLQSKVQEIAHVLIKENVAMIKELVTTDIEIDEQDKTPALELFQGKIKEMFGELLKNSQRIWVLEVSFFEKKDSIKEKSFASLFELFNKKMEIIFADTFRKLIELKAKFRNTHLAVFLNSGYIIRCLEEYIDKMYVFIATHNNTNIMRKEEIAGLASPDLTSILHKEYLLLTKSMSEKTLELRQKYQTELRNASPRITASLLREMSGYSRLLSFLSKVNASQNDHNAAIAFTWVETVCSHTICDESDEPLTAYYKKLQLTFASAASLTTLFAVSTHPKVLEMINLVTTVSANIQKRLLALVTPNNVQLISSHIDDIDLLYFMQNCKHLPDYKDTYSMIVAAYQLAQTSSQPSQSSSVPPHPTTVKLLHLLQQ